MSDEDVIHDEAMDEGGDAGFEDSGEGYSEAHEAALAEAQAERLTRQAFLHGVDKQLFKFLFANCCFFAAAFVSWERAAPGTDADPSTLVAGIHTVRGGVLLALSLYGFWTCVLNIFHGQMKLWPFLWSALIGATVAIGGIGAGIDRWDAVSAHLNTFQKKALLDDIVHRLAAFPPGTWLCTIGAFLVFWVLLTGLLKGRAAGKAAAPAEGRRRRR